jgi:hypothetical protein
MGIAFSKDTPNWREQWPHSLLDWSPAYRVIPTRFPAVNLFDRVASPQDFEALYGPIMAAFTHLNPNGSRFSDGSYGVFYCGRERQTAIAETRYHSGLFLAATNEAPTRQQMRLYTVRAHGDVVDLRGDAIARTGLDPRILAPDDYGPGKALGRAVRAAGAPGIVYPSVRDPQGECLAALRTTMLRGCRHAAYLEYNWNGEAIDYVFELNQVG